VESWAPRQTRGRGRRRSVRSGKSRSKRLCESMALGINDASFCQACCRSLRVDSSPYHSKIAARSPSMSSHSLLHEVLVDAVVSCLIADRVVPPRLTFLATTSRTTIASTELLHKHVHLIPIAHFQLQHVVSSVLSPDHREGAGRIA
jgi:hypothetical protein